VLVGKLVTGKDGYCVAKLRKEDARPVRQSRAAVRCLRKAWPVAKALEEWAKSDHLAGTVDSVKLVVLLCAILGVREVGG
jgi:hypothetical protein